MCPHLVGFCFFDLTVDVKSKKFLSPEGIKTSKILPKGKTYGFPLWRENCINAIFAVTPFLYRNAFFKPEA